MAADIEYIFSQDGLYLPGGIGHALAHPSENYVPHRAYVERHEVFAVKTAEIPGRDISVGIGVAVHGGQILIKIYQKKMEHIVFVEKQNDMLIFFQHAENGLSECRGPSLPGAGSR